MKVFLSIILAATAQASLLETREPVTLDTAEFSRIWQEVKQGVPSEPQASADAWQSAMLADDAELACVLLLAWLQQQNPQLPMAQHAQLYAEAVALHRRALAGNPAACVTLAAAYRAGSLGNLQLPVSNEKAHWFEQRALRVENLPR